MRPPTPTLGLPPLFLVDLRVVTTKIIFLFGIFFFFLNMKTASFAPVLTRLGGPFSVPEGEKAGLPPPSLPPLACRAPSHDPFLCNLRERIFSFLPSPKGVHRDSS